jgi:hypothetical protein
MIETVAVFRRNNMSKFCFTTKLFLIFIVFLFLPLNILAQPSEKGLIKAWESLQKNDPKTVVFEKINEGSYSFKTEYFPFDGELKVFEVFLDDRGSDVTGKIIGRIGVELVGLDKEIISKYNYGYSIWSNNNYLYYDIKTGKWISSSDYIKKATSDAMKYRSSSLSNVLDYATVILLVIVFFLLFSYWVNMRKYNNYLKEHKESVKTSLTLIEKSLKLGEEGQILSKENNQLLKEILEELKRQKRTNL